MLALVIFGAAGLMAELFLLEHTEAVDQWIPFVVLFAGIASGLTAAIRPARWSIRVMQVVMALFVATGIVGLYLHVSGNIEFERELDPAARGIVLYWSALRGATPALAPGAMIQLGLLGLIYTFRHPATYGEST